MGMRGDFVHLETFWGGILSGVTFSGGILSGGGFCPGGIMSVPLTDQGAMANSWE